MITEVKGKKFSKPFRRLQVTTSRVPPTSCIAPVASGVIRPSAGSMCPAILVSECLAVVALASTSLVRASLVVTTLVVPLVVPMIVTSLASALVITLAVATGAAILIISPKQVSKELCVWLLLPLLG